MTETKLYPIYRQAVQDFMDAGFKDGDILSKTWLEEHFGMPHLDDGATLTIKECQDRQFKWLQNVEAFKSELLEEHQICLMSVYGEGYRITPPEEQTARSVETFERDARRIYRTAALRLKNVRQERLTTDQRRENMDAVARLAMLQGMSKQITD